LEPERAPSSPSQGSLWPLALLGTLLFALLPSKRNHSGKSHPQDRPSNKDSDTQRQTALTPNIAPAPRDSGSTGESKKKNPLWEKLAVLIALGLLIVNVCQERATQDAVKVASRQLEMTDRPWIKDNVLSAFEMGWQHGSYLGWAVTVRTENVGHSVATGIFPEVKLIAIKGADFIDYPRREAKKVCDDVDGRFEKVKSDPIAWATSVFPSEARDFGGHNVYLLPSEVEAKSFDGGSNLGESIMPMLVGCIVYHYPSSEHAHHTGFIYLLSHNDNPALAESSTVFFGIGKNISKDNVVLKQVGQFAD
jgi:hypothetical protein